jgi:anti-sigma B factor antagonist
MAETWCVSKLDIDIRYLEGIPIIKATGDCDLITSNKLRAATENLLNISHCRIVFDLRDMIYIDSSGFRMLLEARNKAVGKNGDIILVSLSAPVEHMFDLMGLANLIARTDTVEEAVARLKNIKCA